MKARAVGIYLKLRAKLREIVRAGKGRQQNAEHLPARKAAGVRFIRRIVQLINGLADRALLVC